MARKIPTCSDPGAFLLNARTDIDKEKREEKINSEVRKRGRVIFQQCMLWKTYWVKEKMVILKCPDGS